MGVMILMHCWGMGEMLVEWFKIDEKLPNCVGVWFEKVPLQLSLDYESLQIFASIRIACPAISTALVVVHAGYVLYWGGCSWWEVPWRPELLCNVFALVSQVIHLWQFFVESH